MAFAVSKQLCAMAISSALESRCCRSGNSEVDNLGRVCTICFRHYYYIEILHITVNDTDRVNRLESTGELRADSGTRGAGTPFDRAGWSVHLASQVHWVGSTRSIPAPRCSGCAPLGKATSAQNRYGNRASQERRCRGPEAQRSLCAPTASAAHRVPESGDLLLGRSAVRARFPAAAPDQEQCPRVSRVDRIRRPSDPIPECARC